MVDANLLLAKFPGWTLILGWTLINFDNKFQGGRLFQRGRLLDSEEYRPISLTCILCKIMGKRYDPSFGE